MRNQSLKVVPGAACTLDPQQFAAVRGHVLWEIGELTLGDGLYALPGYYNDVIRAVPQFNGQKVYAELSAVVCKVAMLGHGSDFETLAKDTFGSTRVVWEGDRVYFDYRMFGEEVEHGFPVWLTLVDPGTLEAAQAFYSYNGAGLVLGRVAQYMGMDFNETGLRFPFGGSREPRDSVLVTADMHQTLTFLGYDPEPYLKGFTCAEDLHAYAASGKHFNWRMFELELSRTQTPRGRRKRAIDGFVSWMAASTRVEARTLPEPKYWQYDALRRFPGFALRYRNRISDVLLDREIESRLDQNMVEDATGLPQEEMRNFLQEYCLDHGGPVVFGIWLVEHSRAEVLDDLMCYCETYVSY